jgi:sugar/nucleoside kinase (ribokinase family)
LDLLLVGGLTIDRFSRGSSAGGSVIHAARAAAGRGLRVGVVTSAGPEAEAARGVAELRKLTAFLHVTPARATTTFRHREGPDGRRLWLEQLGGPVSLPADASTRIWHHAVLFAPVAGEIDAASLRVWGDTWSRGAILQGWLRTLTAGDEVAPRPTEQIDPLDVAGLATFDVLIASREDLRASGATPHEQLTTLRQRFGRTPALVVSDGSAGLWLDVPRVLSSSDRRAHLRAPWVVPDADTVGAGDILAAFLTRRHEDPTAGWRTRAEDAMRIVAEELHGRRHR